MKKTIFTLAFALIAMTTITFAASSKKITDTNSAANEKAIKKQAQLFGIDSNAKWNTAGNGFIAEFTQEDKQGTSAFDEKGNWVYTIFRYNEDKMDEALKENVKSVYYMYQISGIEQIEQPSGNTIYLFHIENKNDLKIIRVDADDMQVVQELTKQ